MKAEDYITIQGWMRTELELKGNELMVYALVYGFSKDGESWFTGSRAYIADWCGCSKGTASNCLASLCERGLIQKRTKTVNGVTLNDYRAIVTPSQNLSHPLSKIVTPPTKNCEGGVSKIVTHIDKDNDRDIDRTKKGQEAIVDDFTDNAELKAAIMDFIEMRKAMKSKMTDRALTLLLGKLQTMGRDDSERVALLNQSIVNGWKSIYPLKDHSKRECDGLGWGDLEKYAIG